jgi:hypothetical protein
VIIAVSAIIHRTVAIPLWFLTLKKGYGPSKQPFQFMANMIIPYTNVITTGIPHADECGSQNR